MFELGDTLSNENGTKVIVIMTFFVSSDGYCKIEDKKLGGFWGCDASIKEVRPYYVDPNDEVKELQDFEKAKNIHRSRCVLIEKDFNMILQKETAKKFASILIKHL
tara:strand:- start:111 stop:428 length:318 start_codon:yes stop_codon:yes gene_type:complete